MQLTVPGFAWPLMAATLPVAATAAYLILRRFWSEIGSDRNGHREAEAAHRAIAIRLVLFVMALDVLVMLNLGGVEWIRARGPRLVVVLFGSVFIVIGNLLPRTRPNLALGIRTSRTLSDRPFWIRLHRTCGYLSVALGVVIVVAGLSFSGPVIGPVVGAAALGSVAALLVTYRRQRRV
jgi:uncharacterized membrane protein